MSRDDLRDGILPSPIEAAAAAEALRREDPDAQTVVLRTYLEPSPAYADHAVLAAEGIDACVVDIMATAGGVMVAGASSMRVDLLVRREDIDAASRLLERNRRDSVDIDWDEVDVGAPADETAARIAGAGPRTHARPPRLSRGAKVAIVLFIAVGGPVVLVRAVAAVLGASP